MPLLLVSNPKNLMRAVMGNEELEDGEVPGDFLVLVLVVLLPLMRELLGSLPLVLSMVGR